MELAWHCAWIRLSWSDSSAVALAKKAHLRYNNARMSTSPRPSKKSQTTDKPQSALAAPMILIITALDTTWRAFLPTIGGTFLGIWLDNLFNITPVALIICLVLGVALSIFLIARQLINVRKQY